MEMFKDDPIDGLQYVSFVLRIKEEKGRNENEYLENESGGCIFQVRGGDGKAASGILEIWCTSVPAGWLHCIHSPAAAWMVNSWR